jgi:hypothetical protein
MLLKFWPDHWTLLFFVLSLINPRVLLILVSQHRWDNLLHVVFELILDAIYERNELEF